MARKRKDPKEIKLSQPDRSGPTDKTLLQWAEERELFAQAEHREQQAQTKRRRPADADKDGGSDEKGEGDKSVGEKEPESDFTPAQERTIEAVLYAATLSTVHFMLDVLVQNQYAQDIDFTQVTLRTGQALLGMAPLFPPISSHSRFARLAIRYRVN